MTNFSRSAAEKRPSHLSGQDRICEAWNPAANSDVGLSACSSAPRFWTRAHGGSSRTILSGLTSGPSTTALTLTKMNSDQQPPELTHVTLNPKAMIQGARS